MSKWITRNRMLLIVYKLSHPETNILRRLKLNVKSVCIKFDFREKHKSSSRNFVISKWKFILFSSVFSVSVILESKLLLFYFKRRKKTNTCGQNFYTQQRIRGSLVLSSMSCLSLFILSLKSQYFQLYKILNSNFWTVPIRKRTRG